MRSLGVGITVLFLFCVASGGKQKDHPVEGRRSSSGSRKSRGRSLDSGIKARKKVTPQMYTELVTSAESLYKKFEQLLKEILAEYAYIQSDQEHLSDDVAKVKEVFDGDLTKLVKHLAIEQIDVDNRVGDPVPMGDKLRMSLSRLTMVNTNNEIVNKKIERVKAKLAKLREWRMDLVSLDEQIQETGKQRIKYFQKTKAGIEELKAQHSEGDRKKVQLEAKLKRLEDEVQEERAKAVERKKQEVAKMDARADEFQRKIEALKRNKDPDAEARKEIRKLKGKIQAGGYETVEEQLLESDVQFKPEVIVKVMADELAALEDERNAALQDIEDLEQQPDGLAFLMENFQEAQKQKSKAKEKMGSMQQKQKEIEEEKKDIQKKIQELQDMLDKLQKDGGELARGLIAQQNIVDEIGIKVQNLQNAIDAEEEKITPMREDLQNIKDKIEKFGRMMADGGKKKLVVWSMLSRPSKHHVAVQMVDLLPTVLNAQKSGAEKAKKIEAEIPLLEAKLHSLQKKQRELADTADENLVSEVIERLEDEMDGVRGEIQQQKEDLDKLLGLIQAADEAFEEAESEWKSAGLIGDQTPRSFEEKLVQMERFENAIRELSEAEEAQFQALFKIYREKTNECTEMGNVGDQTEKQMLACMTQQSNAAEALRNFMAVRFGLREKVGKEEVVHTNHLAKKVKRVAAKRAHKRQPANKKQKRMKRRQKKAATGGIK